MSGEDVPLYFGYNHGCLVRAGMTLEEAQAAALRGEIDRYHVDREAAK